MSWDVVLRRAGAARPSAADVATPRAPVAPPRPTRNAPPPLKTPRGPVNSPPTDPSAADWAEWQDSDIVSIGPPAGVKSAIDQVFRGVAWSQPGSWGTRGTWLSPNGAIEFDLGDDDELVPEVIMHIRGGYHLVARVLDLAGRLGCEAVDLARDAVLTADEDPARGMYWREARERLVGAALSDAALDNLYASSRREQQYARLLNAVAARPSRPSSSESLAKFKRAATQHGLPLDIIAQLMELYHVADGFSGMNGLVILPCDDSHLFDGLGVGEQRIGSLGNATLYVAHHQFICESITQAGRETTTYPDLAAFLIAVTTGVRPVPPVGSQAASRIVPSGSSHAGSRVMSPVSSQADLRIASSASSRTGSRTVSPTSSVASQSASRVGSPGSLQAASLIVPPVSSQDDLRVTPSASSQSASRVGSPAVRHSPLPVARPSSPMTSTGVPPRTSGDDPSGSTAARVGRINPSDRLRRIRGEKTASPDLPRGTDEASYSSHSTPHDPPRGEDEAGVSHFRDRVSPSPSPSPSVLVADRPPEVQSWFTTTKDAILAETLAPPLLPTSLNVSFRDRWPAPARQRTSSKPRRSEPGVSTSGHGGGPGLSSVLDQTPAPGPAPEPGSAPEPDATSDLDASAASVTGVTQRRTALASVSESTPVPHPASHETTTSPSPRDQALTRAMFAAESDSATKATAGAKAATSVRSVPSIIDEAHRTEETLLRLIDRVNVSADTDVPEATTSPSTGRPTQQSTGASPESSASTPPQPSVDTSLQSPGGTAPRSSGGFVPKSSASTPLQSAADTALQPLAGTVPQPSPGTVPQQSPSTPSKSSMNAPAKPSTLTPPVAPARPVTPEQSPEDHPAQKPAPVSLVTATPTPAPTLAPTPASPSAHPAPATPPPAKPPSAKSAPATSASAESIPDKSTSAAPASAKSDPEDAPAEPLPLTQIPGKASVKATGQRPTVATSDVTSPSRETGAKASLSSSAADAKANPPSDELLTGRIGPAVGVKDRPPSDEASAKANLPSSTPATRANPSSDEANTAATSPSPDPATQANSSSNENEASATTAPSPKDTTTPPTPPANADDDPDEDDDPDADTDGPLGDPKRAVPTMSGRLRRFFRRSSVEASA